MQINPTASPSSRLRILIVDDDPLLLRGLRDMLALWGRATITTAGDAIDAKATLRLEPIDVVVTDWAMAPVGGDALLRWIRESRDCPRPDVPVVVLTGRADLATVRAAWDAGADAVLVKPASATDIARRIETVLQRPRRSPRMAGVGPEAGDVPETGYVPDIGGSPVTLFAEPSAPHAALPGPAARRALPGPSRGRAARAIPLPDALDRLEALVMGPTIPNRNRLRDAAAVVRHAADHPSTVDLASSLAALVLEVPPETEGFAETVAAHIGALRWAMAGRHGGPKVQTNLLGCLQATVRALSRHPGTPGDAAAVARSTGGARRPRATGRPAGHA